MSTCWPHALSTPLRRNAHRDAVHVLILDDEQLDERQALTMALREIGEMAGRELRMRLTGRID